MSVLNSENKNREPTTLPPIATATAISDPSQSYFEVTDISDENVEEYAGAIMQVGKV